MNAPRCCTPFVSILAFAVACAATPQQTPVADERDAPFQLERLMRDPEWIARSPQDPWWSPDGESIFFWRAVAGQRGERELVVVDLASGAQHVLADDERHTAGLRGGAWDTSRRRLLAERAGDLFVHDGELVQLTRTRARESGALWLTSGDVAFQRDGAWLARELASGREVELVSVLAAEDPDAAEAKRLEERDFHALQSERLFDVVRERGERRTTTHERERALELADPTRAPRPWYVGKDRRAFGEQLAPNAEALAFRLGTERSRDGKRDQMAEWITDSGLAAARDVRANVGTESSRAEELVVLDLVDRERVDVDLTALFAAPKTDEDEAQAAPTLTFQRLVWSPDGTWLAAQARDVDNENRWLFLVGERGKVLVPVHHLEDEAWLNGRFDAFGWLPDGSALWYLSEETGWSQLYLFDVASRTMRALTAGEYEVDAVEPDPAGRWLYFRSTREHPGVQELYRVSPDGGEPERLTTRDGRLSYTLSPDGEEVLLLASRMLEPPDLFAQDTRPGASERRLTDSVSEEFRSLPWTRPQLVAVPTRHGVAANARLFLPPQQPSPAQGERAAVLFVHGAGYLQSAHAGWPRYLRETLFHTLLARRGVVVLDIDYRASAGYGRAWRTAIHGKLGEAELDDLEDGVRWLAREHGVDPQRVGVYGGSYGGFLVLQALFTRPELFACGAALRPVTDWAHYNHPYTSNLLGTPKDAEEAYAQSSPIEHAEGLAAPLLICHGLVDDNVLAKDSVRLVQRLIELGKTDWELAVYPAEAHAFEEPSSWFDQYRRVLELFEEHLEL